MLAIHSRLKSNCLTAGIQASTGVILSLSGMFDLTIHGERYCMLGEFWKEADGDQLLLRPGEETIWYYAHEQDKVKRLCNDMTELLEKKLARQLSTSCIDESGLRKSRNSVILSGTNPLHR